MMGKKSVGGTLFFPHLITMGKKSVGYIFNFHRTEGEKECSSLFLSICKVGEKSGGGTLFFPICKVGKKSVGVHCFSPSVRWEERVGGYTVFPHL